MQELTVTNNELKLIGPSKAVLDPTGIFWHRGTLEGPEIIRVGEYYYLFAAACGYCSPCYTEAVTRSKNIWGPYEPLGIPLLSTGVVGNHATTKKKLIGPGHSSFILDEKSKTWYVVWHASVGSGPFCESNDENSPVGRKAFISPMKFTGGADGGWPYVDFDT